MVLGQRGQVSWSWLDRRSGCRYEEMAASRSVLRRMFDACSFRDVSKIRSVSRNDPKRSLRGKRLADKRVVPYKHLQGLVPCGCAVCTTAKDRRG